MVRHQSADAYDSALRRLTCSNTDDIVVVLVGPACRTWYVDIAKLRNILSDLFDVRPFSVLHGGKFPFDMYTEELCRTLGIPCFMSGPSRDVRLSKKYERDFDLAYGAALVIAFPAEEPSSEEGPHAQARSYPPESADLGVIRGARELGVPILSVYRDGRATWEAGNEVHQG